MLEIRDVQIKGVSTTVPRKKVNNSQLRYDYTSKEIEKLISNIGVKYRHIAEFNTTAADLCITAAEQLLSELEWDRSSIDGLIFVTQTPEYQLPANAIPLQHQLGLSKSTVAFDVNLGCSGYVYGLYLASSLINSGLKMLILLVGDTISKLVNPGDHSTELLFGDAGSATALESQTGHVLHFEFGSDGSGAEHIIAKKPQYSTNGKQGLTTSYLEMNGSEVFSFAVKEVPPMINLFYLI